MASEWFLYLYEHWSSSSVSEMVRGLKAKEEDKDETPPVWQTVLVSVTLAVMFLFMLKDWIGPDWVMVTGLIIFMVSGIVDSKEALAGFSNEGILTVMSLFVMAEGVTRTGLLDYYMGLVLGNELRTVSGVACCGGSSRWEDRLAQEGL
jgi:di/tricarboxylate transporter